MEYYDEKLQSLQQQCERKKHLESLRQNLYQQRRELTSKVQELKYARMREQEDVDRLEGRSLAAFYYRVIGRKDEMLSKEREEVYAASVKYDAAEKELEAVVEDIERYSKELKEIDGCERRFAELLAEKKNQIKTSGNPLCEQVFQLEEQINILDSQIREIQEAISAGQRAQSTAEQILNSLKSAEDWGTWDLIGGGVISHVAKHSHLDTAQGQVEQLQVELRRFKTELADVTIYADMNVKVEGFLQFADWFFDGLFADWAVLDRINRSQSSVQQTKSQIGSALMKLKRLLDAAEQEKDRRKRDLNDLIIQAKI